MAVNEMCRLVVAVRQDAVDASMLRRTSEALEMLEAGWDELDQGLSTERLYGLAASTQTERAHVSDLRSMLRAVLGGGPLRPDEVQTLADLSLRSMGVNDVAGMLE